MGSPMTDPHSTWTSRYSCGISKPRASILITGTQALVRMVLAQAEKDRRAGLNTGGFVSGYRGSPLGALDTELWRAQKLLKPAGVRFLPAINEDMAATAIVGTQKVETDPTRTRDAVFALWYGKGPGVDRSGDAIKHGNYYGTSPHGGVVVVVGDDHGGVSSSMSHQSDSALIAWGVPVIHPASVRDYVKFGLWAWALSRFSGLWVGLKAISETVESSVRIEAGDLEDLDAPPYVVPPVDAGADGLHWRWPDLPGPQLEIRMQHKIAAALAFAKANPLDVVAVDLARPRLLIAAVGKAYADVMETLRRARLSPEDLAAHGVALIKVGLVSPLSPLLLSTAMTAEEVFVIEEKMALVEVLLKDGLYSLAPEQRPRIIGKRDAAQARLLPADVELSVEIVAAALGGRLRALGVAMPHEICRPVPEAPAQLRRTAYFCAGCPHNASTKVPDGSRAQLGIGCHALAAQIPERNTSGSVQMGGEGADWIGQSPFVSESHIFQNLGDGTFYHSGQLAIRQAVAARVNITFKVLYNDVVAMTGGQSVDGALTVHQVTRLIAAEGVGKIYLLTPNPHAYRRSTGLAPGVVVRHRDRLDAVQRELRTIPGVTALVFEQVCAIEDRRRRKSAPLPDARPKIVINEQVCEGCGDCQKKSNCMAVVPLETPMGRKRAIDQEACNSDLSCLDGFCPSFVTISGSAPAAPATGASARRAAITTQAARLPPAAPVLGDEPFNLLIAGTGGTGVVTIGAIAALAAHLHGIDVTTLNFTGFAQKGGAVRCHLRFARAHGFLHQARIGHGCADAVIAADLVVAASAETLAVIRTGHTRIVANMKENQIGAMLRSTELQIDTDALRDVLQRHAGARHVDAIDAHAIATRDAGAKYVNMFLFGFAWQQGLVPLPLEAIADAIAMNGIEVDDNALAFASGRVAAFDLDHPALPAAEALPATLAETIDTCADYLSGYQNTEYAARYRRRVDTAVAAAGRVGDNRLALLTASNLFRLMAYKDEYEVARLLSSKSFIDGVRASHGPRARLTFHLRPPLFPERWTRRSMPGKLAIGQWILPLMRSVASLRWLRATRFDPFGWQADRRQERRLLAAYETMLDQVLPLVTGASLEAACALLAVPAAVRGYGYVKRPALVAAIPALESARQKFDADMAQNSRIIQIKRVG